MIKVVDFGSNGGVKWVDLSNGDYWQFEAINPDINGNPRVKVHSPSFRKFNMQAWFLANVTNKLVIDDSWDEVLKEHYKESNERKLEKINRDLKHFIETQYNL